MLIYAYYIVTVSKLCVWNGKERNETRKKKQTKQNENGISYGSVRISKKKHAKQQREQPHFWCLAPGLGTHFRIVQYTKETFS